MNSSLSKKPLPVVSADWLKAHLFDDDLRVIDASWHLPAAARDAQAEFLKGRIPGAVFFDIDEYSAPSDLPHMLPDAAQFSQIAGSLGIADHHCIVVYDSVGLFSSARVWWMFRHFGARKVFVLDGGLPAWSRSGGELMSSSSMRAPTSAEGQSSTCGYMVGTTSDERQKEVLDLPAMREAMHDSHSIILDARPAGRFSGAEKEVRPGLRSGHIPSSVSLPFKQVLNEQGQLKSVPELRQLFASLALHEGVRVVTTCGSGVTAAVLCLALECAGYENVALYDGSWSEWGAQADVPVATGS